MQLKFGHFDVPNPNKEAEEAKKKHFLSLANKLEELLAVQVHNKPAYNYLMADSKTVIDRFRSIVEYVNKYDLDVAELQLDDETILEIQRTYDKAVEAVQELNFMKGLPPIEL